MNTKAHMKWLAQNRGRKKPLPFPKGEPAVKREEREYLRQIDPLLKELALLVHEELFRKIKKIQGQQDQLRPSIKTDAADDEIKESMNLIRSTLYRNFTPEEIKRIAERRGISVANLNKEFMNRGVKRVLDIDVFAMEPYLSDQIGLFAAQNSNLITSMTDEYLNKVEQSAFRGLANGTRAADIEDQIIGLIDPRVGNIRARAELIARDQVSKLNGQLTELRQTEIGVTRYKWRIVGDERTRDMHRELEGETFSWDDPPVTNSKGDRNHPGGDYQCRCWAEPVLSDLVEGVGDNED